MGSFKKSVIKSQGAMVARYVPYEVKKQLLEQARRNLERSIERAGSRYRIPGRPPKRMRGMYYLAAILDYLQVDGTRWHVDHIYPLHGRTVSGFHCLANLQIIPAAVNLSKSNKYPALSERLIDIEYHWAGPFRDQNNQYLLRVWGLPVDMLLDRG